MLSKTKYHEWDEFAYSMHEKHAKQLNGWNPLKPSVRTKLSTNNDYNNSYI